MYENGSSAAGFGFKSVSLNNCYMRGGSWHIIDDGAHGNWAVTNNILYPSSSLVWESVLSGSIVNNLFRDFISGSFLLRDYSGPAWVWKNNVFYDANFEYDDYTVSHT